MKTKYHMRTTAIRQIPEPNIRTKNGRTARRWTLLVNVSDLPQGMSDAPNPREPKVNRKLWKEIRSELLNDGDAPANIFHVKNKGITLCVDHIHRDRKKNGCVLTFDSNLRHGLLDGGHTYTIITESQNEIKTRNSNGEDINQFVRVEVLENYPPNLISEIARGLNTGIQVKEKSLANLDNKFDPIKEAIKGKPYEHNVAYNENGSEDIDIETLIAHLYMFNTKDFSKNPFSGTVPLRAYSSKAGYRDHFLKNLPTYNALAPFVGDIVELSDYISANAKGCWNKSKKGRKGGSLRIIKNGKVKFHFLDIDGDCSLERSALFPILASFRVFMDYDESTNTFSWSKSLADMKKIWDTDGVRFLEIAKDTTYGSAPHMRGRNKQLWEMCLMLMNSIK